MVFLQNGQTLSKYWKIHGIFGKLKKLENSWLKWTKKTTKQVTKKTVKVTESSKEALRLIVTAKVYREQEKNLKHQPDIIWKYLQFK